jgi:hypothetical protein
MPEGDEEGSPRPEGHDGRDAGGAAAKADGMNGGIVLRSQKDGMETSAIDLARLDCGNAAEGLRSG